MKTVRVLVSAVVVLALVPIMTGTAFAVITYTTGFQVQNLSDAAANVIISYYDKNGNKVIPDVTDTIPASGSKTYFPIAAPAGFNGSAAVVSDQPVAAIVNTLGDVSPSAPGGASGAAYVAASSGNTTVLIPLVMKDNNGFTTWFNVQNMGVADAKVDVLYTDGLTRTATIKPGTAFTFDQAQEAHTPATRFVGSATVTSDQPVAAAVMEVGAQILFAYSGVASGVPFPVMPIVNANNVGYETGIQIQNAGGADTQVTVSYKPATAGTACTETQLIPAGQSNTFALYPFAGVSRSGITTNCAGRPAKFIGTAKVSANSANQPLIAVVNQLLNPINGEAYNAFDPNAATSKVVMPLIMDRNAGYFTGFSVMNIGASTTLVNCTFVGATGTVTYTVGQNLAPDEALFDLQGTKIQDQFVGSATCAAGANGKIVGVVNELGSAPNVDQLLVYEAINQ